MRRGDAAAAERALVEAVATSPANARAFARLGGLYKKPKGRDDVGHARALSAVIGLRAGARARWTPRWFAALGQLEIQSLDRIRDGIAHLQRAISLDASLLRDPLRARRRLRADGRARRGDARGPRDDHAVGAAAAVDRRSGRGAAPAREVADRRASRRRGHGRERAARAGRGARRRTPRVASRPPPRAHRSPARHARSPHARHPRPAARGPPHPARGGRRDRRHRGQAPAQRSRGGRPLVPGPRLAPLGPPHAPLARPPGQAAGHRRGGAA